MLVGGTVAAVDPDTLTVTLADGSSTDYAIDTTTQVVVDGEQTEVVELPLGENVLVHAEEAGETDETDPVADVVLAGDVAEMPMGPGGLGGPGGGPVGQPPAREEDTTTTPESTPVGQTV